MRASRENLIRHGVEPLAQWLIHAAKRRSTLTYGQAKRRLETEFGFDTIFSIMMGYPAGAVMDRLLYVEPACPLVNVLLVRQGDGMPGDGAGSFMASYLDKPRLATPGYRNTYLMRWRAACDEIATDVYAFRGWERVYREAFGHRLPATVPSAGAEHDGIRHARTGEGPNHRALRLWIEKNPRRVRRAYADFRTDTEVILESADRVDVVYYGQPRRSSSRSNRSIPMIRTSGAASSSASSTAQ
ncbi:MAG: hypothetical protein OXD42_05015 [Rhodospirillaceae bacterium]|nr:hypothetical protein [Rhodospirillaceae bacterium]